MPTFQCALPSPRVDLPSGASVQFEEGQATVDASTGKELKAAASEEALAYLAITEVKTAARGKEQPTESDE